MLSVRVNKHAFSRRSKRHCTCLLSLRNQLRASVGHVGFNYAATNRIAQNRSGLIALHNGPDFETALAQDHPDGWGVGTRLPSY